MTTKTREDHKVYPFGDPHVGIHISRYQSGMPSTEDWMRTVRGSGMQNIYDYTMGLTDDIDRIRELFDRIRINIGTSANTGSHKLEAGGDANMLEQITNAFLNLQNALEVYHRKIREQHEFVVVFKEDHPKLGRFLAEVQVRAFKEYGIYIESTFELEEEFDADELPEDYSQIGFGG